MTYSRLTDTRCPLPVEPMVLSVHLTNTTGSTNVPVYVPWDNVQMTYAYTVTLVAIDATGAMEIDLELDAASGTEFASITVAASAAIGDIDEATIASYPTLSYSDTSLDAINVEIDGSGAAAGSVMLYMYFEKKR